MPAVAFNRSVAHLISEKMQKETIKAYFQSVEDLFNADYLNSEKALGPLPILWKRLDAVATNELFALGRAIHMLQSQNKVHLNEWLTSVASTAKKHAKNHGKSEGFIREIIYCGSIFNTSGEIFPGQKAQQAFDVAIKTPNTNFVISLKKYGKSDKHKEFELYCQELAKALKKKAELHQMNISLTLDMTTSFSDGLLKTLKKEIINSKTPDKILYVDSNKLIMSSTRLEYPDLQRNSGCWQLNVYGPENKNEQTRFVKDIVKEIKNMKKTLDSSATEKDALRTLYVNVNENCDMEFVEKRLQEHYSTLGNTEDIGVDFVMLHKSAVCERKSGPSLKDLTKEIVHDIRAVNLRTDVLLNSATPRFKKYIDNCASQTTPPLKMDGLVGTFSAIAPPTLIGLNFHRVLKNKYIFQKGIYRFSMVEQPDGTHYADLPSVAPVGIACEIIIPEKHAGKNHIFLVSNKIMSPHDDLLIL